MLLSSLTFIRILLIVSALSKYPFLSRNKRFGYWEIQINKMYGQKWNRNGKEVASVRLVVTLQIVFVRFIMIWMWGMSD
jgi:hypothetical protein